MNEKSGEKTAQTSNKRSSGLDEMAGKGKGEIQ